MGAEQRRHPRVAIPVDGRWQGGSGGAHCRISDISLGGCYIQCLSQAARGEETTVTICFSPARSMTLPGSVVYSDPRMGFAVEFYAMAPDTQEELRQEIAALVARRATARVPA